jgi:N-acetyl-anhydromuramyl-L-alanine amidase AmpD
VRAKWTDLQHLKNPGPRLALDILNARWDANVTLPEGTGSVTQLRTGHPTPDTARLVLDMRGPRVTPGQVSVSTDGLSTALLPFGTRVAKNTPAATPDQVFGAIQARTIKGVVRRGSSRGGGIPGVLRSPGTRVPPGSDLAAIEPDQGADHNAWRYVVIHHSASPNGNLAAFDRAHRSKGWDGVAYHFVITNGLGGPDGGLEVSDRWKSQKHGAHAGALPPPVSEDERNDYNEFGIGICLVGNFEKAPPTAAQVKTLVELLQHLRSRHGIADEDIVGHGQVKGTACPGKAFPWSDIYTRLALTRPNLPATRGARRTHERCPWCLKAEQAKNLATEVSRQK